MSVQRGYGNASFSFNVGIFPFVSLTGLQLKGLLFTFQRYLLGQPYRHLVIQPQLFHC